MTDATALKNSKLVILIGHFGRGGSQRQAFLLARHLRQAHGLNVEVWSLIHGGHNDAYAKEFESAGIPVHVLGLEFPQSRFRILRIFQFARQLQRIIQRLRASGVKILLPFTTWPNVVAGLAYRFAGVRLCIWGERHAGGERVPRAERVAIRQLRTFVANSTAGAKFLATEMGVPRERIFFVPNGIEQPSIETAGTDWRSRLGLSAGQLLVVKVANVTGFKDHATLLRAWKIVQDSWTGGEMPVLALAGAYNADHIYDECQRIVREGGLEPTVRFLGSIRDVPALLSVSDVAAFSSPNEGMPNGVLECMAAGKAIVASDLPGVRDALGPYADDVVVPPGDHVRFADVLLGLLRSEQMRAALGAANRIRVQTEFSVARMADRHLQIILDNYPSAGRNRGVHSKLLGTAKERHVAEADLR